MGALACPSLVMQALRLLLLTLMASVASASTSFQPLDRVEGWLIERRLDANQIRSAVRLCQDLGTWFSARVHLDANDEMVVPCRDCIGRTKRGWRLCVMRSGVVAPVFFICSG